MNYLCLLFLFIGLNCFSQNEFELCDEKLNKRIIANTSSDNISWSVQPLIPFQQENDILYITFEDVGTYLITAKFDNGRCYSEDKLIIKIIQCEETYLYIPNSFTPNNDNNNDYFGAYGINIKAFSMEIYNRWGELIFVSDDINNRWDGIYQYTPCQNDVYTYIIKYKNINNRPFFKTGRVTLIN
jgi:gliding motility-associated-like protein